MDKKTVESVIVIAHEGPLNKSLIGQDLLDKILESNGSNFYGNLSIPLVK